MPCNHPLKAFSTGLLTENGKDDYVICPSTCGDVLSVEMLDRMHRPYATNHTMKLIAGKTYLTDPLALPCGKCQGCRQDRAKYWKIRCCLEKQYHPFCYFVTLTYDDKALPTDKYGCPSVVKKDLQKFFKRLRRRRVSFRYFASGEYGSIGKRPHYHFLMFTDKELGLIPKGINDYQCPVIASAWKFGIHQVKIADDGLIAYTAGYVEKKIVDPDWNSYPVKPFITMSRRPGLGVQYLSDHNLSLGKVYGDFGSCHHSSIPPAFKKKLEQEVWFKAYKQHCIEVAKKSNRAVCSVYGIGDQELALEARESAYLHNLEKIRKESL